MNVCTLKQTAERTARAGVNIGIAVCRNDVAERQIRNADSDVGFTESAGRGNSNRIRIRQGLIAFFVETDKIIENRNRPVAGRTRRVKVAVVSRNQITKAGASSVRRCPAGCAEIGKRQIILNFGGSRSKNETGKLIAAVVWKRNVSGDVRADVIA